MKNEVSIDCVIFGFKDGELKVLLIKRKQEPQKNKMALPGDFLERNESLDICAQRTLGLITNINDIFLEQIGAFSEVDRYPNKRVITVGFYALINIEQYKPEAGYTAESLEWCCVNNLPALAFDHFDIIQKGLTILQKKIRLEPIGFNLLPEKFSLTQLQMVYEAVLNIKLNKRNFRSKLNQMKLLINSGEKQTNVAHKPAILYSFNKDVYKKLTSEGFYFNL